MRLYRNLPVDIQNKVDNYIRDKIKIYFNESVLTQLEKFHKKRLISIIYRTYAEQSIKYRLYWGYDIILNDIFSWMNYPYSKNTDTPFSTGLLTGRFIDIVKKINPKSVIRIPLTDNGVFLNKTILELFYNEDCHVLSVKEIVFSILRNLEYTQLEELYGYRLGNFDEFIDNNINNITLRYS